MPLSGETVRTTNRCFKAAMSKAVELELIKSNPLCKVVLPKKSKVEKDFFNQDEIRGEVFKDPKSESSIRKIPLPVSVMKELKIGYMHYKEKKLAYGKGFVDSGFIFCKENGEPYKPSTIAQRYNRFLKRNGFRHIKFHNVRVSQASILTYNNVSPKTIQKILGHSSLEMTLNVYAQPVSAEMDEVSAMMKIKQKVRIREPTYIKYSL